MRKYSIILILILIYTLYVIDIITLSIHINKFFFFNTSRNIFQLLVIIFERPLINFFINNT